MRRAQPTDAKVDKPVIGLMGGIGSGKSAVARDLASLGCAVIDADALAQAELNAPEVVERLVSWWGPEVLREGRVDRAAVARRVFGSPEELRRLEGLIHPRVHARRSELRRELGEREGVVAIVEDCPLLLESGLEASCDALVFVEAELGARLARVASKRGWGRAELERRESLQAALDTKAARADYVVQNNSGEDERLEHVRLVLASILQKHELRR